MILNIEYETQSNAFDLSFTEHHSGTPIGFSESSQLINSALSGNAEFFDSELNDDVKYFNSDFGEVYEVNNSPVRVPTKVSDLKNDSGFLTEDDVNAILNTNNLKAAKIGWITLLASAWIGEDNLYRQIVEIDGATENSQVDLTPDVEQLAIFYEKDLTFVTENYNGVVTVYAIGQKPTNDYTIQVTITEVEV